MSLDLKQLGLHPIIRRWFIDRFGTPTEAQTLGWPAIRSGQDTLIAAPTGSGKTLTAFLICIDQLFTASIQGQLGDETSVLYISPLKALSQDIRKNLEMPLAEIHAAAEKEEHKIRRIRAMVRSGDTPQSQRQSMARRPPNILVTTPESFYLLLTTVKGRGMLKTVKTVIIDEIHALVKDKRGSHLALSLERLDFLCGQRAQRIGLSATQKPLELVARFLVGARATDNVKSTCHIINTGHRRRLDLGIEAPQTPLSTVCSHEQWEEVYQSLINLIASHTSTVIFVNTRKLAERITFHLSQILGEDFVHSHHGSLSKERRHLAEEKLKSGQLKAIVATASLELGIDIGGVDLVCQIGSPRSIATFLQRVGRAGHSVNGIPKGRIFALTRDELLECIALISAINEGDLDRLVIPQKPLDILAQQIIAEASCGDISEHDLWQIVSKAFPYQSLTREEFDEVVVTLAEGYAPGQTRRAYITRDRISGMLRAQKGARLVAVTSGGAIPEQGDFRVINADDGSVVGGVNEDFAIESSRGDIFLLGNTSWQIVKLQGTDLLVQDAQGAPPSIPFWLGEAPGRTPELSGHLSRLREDIAKMVTIPDNLDDPLLQLENIEQIEAIDPLPYREARSWLHQKVGLTPSLSLQAVHYIAVQKAALGIIPTQQTIIFERFFDDSGGMQLVIHSPYGMRINKGFGLALRKRFCRSFDFELQASADNDGIVLSLSPQQSFPTEALFSMLNPSNVQALLEQAVLQVPLFNIRWRWNTTRSLAVLRNRNGKRIPPVLQRFRADDLMTAVFPAQTQCQENVTGDIPIPNHPLVRQTMHDCLHEAIDLENLINLLQDIKDSRVKLIAKDTREPSPFAYQLLNAMPYAFLDDAPLEERRARAVPLRRTLPLEDMKQLGVLGPEAIREVRRQVCPDIRTPDELYDFLSWSGVANQNDLQNNLSTMPYDETIANPFATLIAAGRAARVYVQPSRPDGQTEILWTSLDNLDLVHTVYQKRLLKIDPPLALDVKLVRPWVEVDALLLIVQNYLEVHPIASTDEIANQLALDLGITEAILLQLESRGSIVRGHFRSETSSDVEWCERRLLARIHRLTIDGLREEIKPVSVAEFFNFLLAHQHLLPTSVLENRGDLPLILGQLAGFEAPAGAWEGEILSSRLKNFDPEWLNEVTQSGAWTWGRLSEINAESMSSVGGSGMNRIVPLGLFAREDMPWILPPGRLVAGTGSELSDQSLHVYQTLQNFGAQFYSDLMHRTGLLAAALDDVLGELCRKGLVHADGFSAVRPFVNKTLKIKLSRGIKQRFLPAPNYNQGGRWSVFPPPYVTQVSSEDRCKNWAQLLLLRYGVVFKALITHEEIAPPWGELLRVYRRMEARGEVRGGRFIIGPWGEQFATEQTVQNLRKFRRQKGSWTIVAASDPLNLTGTLLSSRLPAAERISRARQMRMAVLDGQIVASADGHDIMFHEVISSDLEPQIRQALLLSGPFRSRYFERISWPKL